MKREFPFLRTPYNYDVDKASLDGWHLAQRFTSLPALNATFMNDTPPLSRILAVGAGANGAQIIFDSFWGMKVARPMPLYSVPGLIDHF